VDTDSTTTWLTLAVAIIVIGKWSKGKGIDVPAVVALGFLAMFVSVLHQINAKLANYFVVLMLLAVVLTYGTDILDKLGLAKGHKIAAGLEAR
jgi:hypothetical protein